MGRRGCRSGGFSFDCRSSATGYSGDKVSGSPGVQPRGRRVLMVPCCGLVVMVFTWIFVNQPGNSLLPF